jgi:hypothetical protein
MSTVESTGSSNGGAGERIPVNRFALFAETLLVGVLVLALSLPLVTLPAAYAAGIAHLERHLSGRDDSVRALWGTFRAALPGSWKLGTTTAAVTAVVVLNLLLATVGQLPATGVVLPATLLVATVSLVVLLRSAAAWSDVAWSDVAGSGAAGERPAPSAAAGTAWQQAFATGKGLSVRDLSGSLLLVAAIFMAVVFVWMLSALFLVVPGALVLAAAAVKMRAARP